MNVIVLHSVLNLKTRAVLQRSVNIVHCYETQDKRESRYVVLRDWFSVLMSLIFLVVWVMQKCYRPNLVSEGSSLAQDEDYFGLVSAAVDLCSAFRVECRRGRS